MFQHVEMYDGEYFPPIGNVVGRIACALVFRISCVLRSTKRPAQSPPTQTTKPKKLKVIPITIDDSSNDEPDDKLVDTLGTTTLPNQRKGDAVLQQPKGTHQPGRWAHWALYETYATVAYKDGKIISLPMKNVRLSDNWVGHLLQLKKSILHGRKHENDRKAEVNRWPTRGYRFADGFVQVFAGEMQIRCETFASDEILKELMGDDHQHTTHIDRVIKVRGSHSLSKLPILPILNVSSMCEKTSSCSLPCNLHYQSISACCSDSFARRPRHRSHSVRQTAQRFRWT